jgi:hypothetical protein
MIPAQYGCLLPDETYKRSNYCILAQNNLVPIYLTGSTNARTSMRQIMIFIPQIEAESEGCPRNLVASPCSHARRNVQVLLSLRVCQPSEEILCIARALSQLSPDCLTLSLCVKHNYNYFFALAFPPEKLIAH